MNKAEIVEAAAAKAGTTKRVAEDVLDGFFTRVTAELKSGGRVAWPGFGVFAAGQRSARKGLNPQTGEAIKIPASKVAKFTASAALKATLNPKRAAAKAKPAAKKPAKAPAKGRKR